MTEIHASVSSEEASLASRDREMRAVALGRMEKGGGGAWGEARPVEGVGEACLTGKI